MLLDTQLSFGPVQAVTASAPSGNAIDITTARNIGVVEPNYMLVTCTVAMTDIGSDSTVTPSLRTSSTATVSGTTLALSGTIFTLATLPAFPALSPTGTQRIVALPPAAKDLPYKEFLDVYYTVANGNLTTGSFTAQITHDIDANQSYAAGYTIQ